MTNRLAHRSVQSLGFVSPTAQLSPADEVPLVATAAVVSEACDPDAPIYARGIEDVARAIARAWAEDRGVWIESPSLGWLVDLVGPGSQPAGQIPRLWFGSGRRSWASLALSRGLQWSIAFLAVLVGLPLWLLLAAAIKAGDSGPVLHVAERAGKDGRPFRFFKLRTLRVAESDAERQEKRAAVIRGEAGGWPDRNGNLLTTDVNDPRATRVGRFLRRTGLDEIPQFLHVLTGRMALVGPRPYVLDETAALKPWHRARLAGLPGITGAWQVAGRHFVTFDQSVLLDIYYLSNASFWLDLKIMLITPSRMVRGRSGA